MFFGVALKAFGCGCHEILGILDGFGTADYTNLDNLPKMRLQRTSFKQSEPGIGMAMLVAKLKQGFIKYLTFEFSQDRVLLGCCLDCLHLRSLA